MYGTLQVYIPNEQGELVRHGIGFEMNAPGQLLWHLWKSVEHGMLCPEDSKSPFALDTPVEDVCDIPFVLREWTPQHEHLRVELAARQLPE